jgi:hypothetical protein
MKSLLYIDTLPIGAEVELDTDRKQLVLKQPSLWAQR